MFNVGDVVYVNDSADCDCTVTAWGYINTHRQAVVKAVRLGARKKPENTELALEFEEDFAGGHHCGGVCLPQRGHFVMATSVELCFEASRAVVTIPNIGFHEKEQVS
jgi:hypothetical protein